MPLRDPFFDLPASSEWNACIGRQGDEDNYVDGYIEAAIELALAVLEKSMYGKRDTLVLPILYNARHAIELTLKLVIAKLVKAGVLNEGHTQNHDISSHWRFIDDNTIPDELFRNRLTCLKPYVESLSNIDNDGQQLRFHRDRDGRRSMKGKSLANIAVIAESLNELQKVLRDLKYSTYSLCDEWRTGTRTGKCSRRDLVEIAKLLPKRQEWGSADFVECKKTIMDRFGIGSRQFSFALKKIEGTRGLSGLVGVETNLVHLTDDQAKFLILEWEKLHPPRDANNDLGIDSSNEFDLDEIRGHLEKEAEVLSTIINELSEEEFADTKTIYYLARDSVFPEHYEKRLELKKAEAKVRGDYRQEVHDLMSKTNFRNHFVEGLRLLGRINFSA